jgi:uncharacterized membrane protein YbhN (UPF0104 family)
VTAARWRTTRLAGGVVLLGVLVWRVGGGPFLDGVRTVQAGTLVAGAALAVATTVCCAWRWSLVAGRLGVRIALPAAVAAYYRSQLLNTALPGGVLGDVHRGVRHGRDAGDTGRGLRAVAWERSAGQVVQVLLTLAVLLVLPSPLRSSLPTLVAAAAVLGLVAVIVVRGAPPVGASLWSRALRVARSDLRDVLLARRVAPAVAVASVLAVAGHVATFLVAARAAGVTAPTVALLPLALLVLLAMAVPLNVAGWGPREGAAAWAFGAAGLGAAQGVTTAVVYGVMVLVAAAPGVLVPLASWLSGTLVREGASG